MLCRCNSMTDCHRIWHDDAEHASQIHLPLRNNPRQCTTKTLELPFLCPYEISQSVALSVCIQCTIVAGIGPSDEHHQAATFTSAITSDVHVYVFCSSFSMLPLPLMHDLFAVSQFLVSYFSY